MTDRSIFFDFDGVIADSFSTAYDVTRMICAGITEDDYREGFEGNINEWQRPTKRHSSECLHDLDFNSVYLPRMAEEVKMLPDMDAVIKDCVRDYALYIISSTPTHPIEDFLRNNDLYQYFHRVLGNDVHHSKTEKMKMLFMENNAVPERSVFITDTLGDVREAAKMSVGAIAVTLGFNRPEILEKDAPFRLVDKPTDLPLAVKDYFTESRGN